jgi:hypothetical protein
VLGHFRDESVMSGVGGVEIEEEVEEDEVGGEAWEGDCAGVLEEYEIEGAGGDEGGKRP